MDSCEVGAGEVGSIVVRQSYVVIAIQDAG